jgi:hypothetical protein
VIRDTPALLGVTVGFALGLCGRGTLVIAFPLLAAETLGLERDVAGFLWAAFAVGAIAGALGLAWLLHRRPQELVALAALGGGGMLMLTWPLAGSLAAAMVLVGLGGLALGPAQGAQIGVRQQLVPGRLHGQVFMTAASLKVGGFAIGSALAGAVAGAGAETVLALAAAFHLAGFAVGTLLMRRRPQAAVVAPHA